VQGSHPDWPSLCLIKEVEGEHVVASCSDDRDRAETGLRLVPLELMHIEVIGEDESSSAQARTYAEYRVFAALARHTPRVRSARVVLRRRERDDTCDTVVCAVTVALVPSGSVRTRACGRHAYAAIDRAVERIGDLMRRRTTRRHSS
jgi:ribosome-associated translation inhibitor RaiA